MIAPSDLNASLTGQSLNLRLFNWFETSESCWYPTHFGSKGRQVVMAVPKRRISKSRRGMRRSHHRVTPQQFQFCKNCENPILPHRVCGTCGFYQGKEVISSGQKEE